MSTELTSCWKQSMPTKSLRATLLYLTWCIPGGLEVAVGRNCNNLPYNLPKQGKNQNLVQSVTFVSFLDEQKSKYFPLGNLVKVNRCLKKVAEGWFPRQRRCTRGLLTTTGGSLQLGTDKQQTKEYRVHECNLLVTEWRRRPSRCRANLDLSKTLLTWETGEQDLAKQQ